MCDEAQREQSAAHWLTELNKKAMVLRAIDKELDSFSTHDGLRAIRYDLPHVATAKSPDAIGAMVERSEEKKKQLESRRDELRGEIDSAKKLIAEAWQLSGATNDRMIKYVCATALMGIPKKQARETLKVSREMARYYRQRMAHFLTAVDAKRFERMSTPYGRDEWLNKDTKVTVTRIAGKADRAPVTS